MADADDTQIPILPSNEDNAEERLEKIGDETPPFSPPDDVASTVPTQNQAYDSADVDSHQAYDENTSNAAEVNDPGDRGVEGYNPPGHQPPQDGPVKTSQDNGQSN